MELAVLNHEFYTCIRAALKEFSKTEENREVYVLALDCDSDVGMISLRYNNRLRFLEKIPEYEEYEKEYGWNVYGLYGSEYDVGEFGFINYKNTELVKHFKDSYYYHSMGVYFGEDEPMEDIKDNRKEILWTMVTEAIIRLKEEIGELEIDTVDDFIFFACDHDQSDEERMVMMRRTVDQELMEQLTK